MSTHTHTPNPKPQKPNPPISAASQSNYDTLIEILTERIKILYEEDAIITEKFQKMRSELDYARPCDIRISNQSQVQADHEIVKKIVQSAISAQRNQNSLNSTITREEQAFHRQNAELQSQIESKMKSIEQLDIDIKTNILKEERTIIELQRSEQALKNILKSKGPLEEAQKRQKQKKMKINQIRYIREMLASLKEQKVVRIREVIQCLGLLLQCRQDRSNKIQRAYDYGERHSLETTAKLLENFIDNLSYLNQQKGTNSTRDLEDTRHFLTDKKKSHSRENSLSKNSSNTPTPRNSFTGNINSFNLTQQKKKNHNKLQTKKLVNLHSPFLQRDRKYANIEDLVSQVYRGLLQYQEAIKWLGHLREVEGSYFRGKSQRLELEYRVKAMEKSYLVGILGYDPSESEEDGEKYANIINYAIKKCSNFKETLQQKCKEKNKLSQTIRSVEQSIEILKNNLQIILTQPQRKKNALSQIENLLHELSSTHPQKSQTKTLESQLQLQHTKKRVLQNQQQQSAQQGNLQNYKRIALELQVLEGTIKSVQKRLRLEMQSQQFKGNFYGLENQQLWGRIREVFGRFGIGFGVQGIQARSAGELLGKLGRRINPI